MKILLIQIKRIGDLILTTPVVRCLREAFPNAELTLLADSSARDLTGTIAVDRVWIHDKRGSNPWILRGLAGSRPDWCLDFSGTDRSAFFGALSLAPRRVTYARLRRRLLARLAATDFVEASVRDLHTADHYTALLEPLGIARQNVPLDLHLPNDTAAKNLLAGATERFAVLHPGTFRPEKYWRPERWAALADAARSTHGLVPVFTGSSDPAELAHLAKIHAHLKNGPALDLAGRTDLATLAAVIRRATVFCGVDTAAMHLADAVRTPTLALFGPTNPFHWQPRHTRHVVLRAHTKPPFAPGQAGGPMEDISLDEALAALAQLAA